MNLSDDTESEEIDKKRFLKNSKSLGCVADAATNKRHPYFPVLQCHSVSVSVTGASGIPCRSDLVIYN